MLLIEYLIYIIFNLTLPNASFEQDKHSVLLPVFKSGSIQWEGEDFLFAWV